MPDSSDQDATGAENYSVMLNNAVVEWQNVPDVVCQPRVTGRHYGDTSGQAYDLGLGHKTDQCPVVGSNSVQSSVSFGEMWAYLSHMPLPSSQCDADDTLCDNPSWFRSLVNSLSGHSTLNRKMVPERQQIFALAQAGLDNADERQLKMLYTIYTKLTGSQCCDCPRYGAHWQTIGFQGSDPGTDLRGCGLLSLLCTLYVLSVPVYTPLAHTVHRLSHHQRQHFPFMVLAINLTRVSLLALRRGTLNRDSNQRHSPMLALCHCFVCLLCDFHWRWTKNNCTISHSGNVIKELECAALGKQKRLHSQLSQFLLSSAQHSS